MEVSRKILAILMAMFILLTAVGFSLNTHYCTATNKTVVSFNSIKSCCNVASEEGCSNGCCHDETEYIVLSSEISQPAVTTNISPIQFVALVQFILPDGLFDQDVEVFNKYLSYSPPLLFRDIPVRVQSFLI